MEKLYWRFPDGNVSDLVDARRIDSLQDTGRKLQFHSSLVRRLALETQMEGHSGCVNAIAWNSRGSLLISGSDDTKINIWNYEDRKLKHSIETGHSANIFCTKFLPETSDELVVSGAGDAEVRVFNLSRSPTSQNLSPFPSALYRCHTRRVKKLAVEAGNPHVVWSASEDGTMRQHDFRERSSCRPAGAPTQECRNVLIDLRNGGKKSLGAYPKNCLSLKSCDISPTRPHLILIGGSDAFGRLYDRRMLPPLSSCRLSSRPPSCVSYFCPVHLSEQRKSSLHLTHVGFSPNGEEVLLSYSGEHVYLMDVNTEGSENTMRYSVGDIKKHLYLQPFPFLPEISSFKSIVKKKYPSKYDLQRVEMRSELAQVAKKYLERGKVLDYLLRGIEACNEVLDGKYYDSDPLLRLDCFCIRAALLLKRKWKNDVYMAIRDCNEARVLDGSSYKAHYYMAEALLQLGRLKEALEYANAAEFLTDSKSEFTRKVQALKENITTAETQKNKRKQDSSSSSSTRHTTRRARLRSLSDMFLSNDDIINAEVSLANDDAQEDETGTDPDADENEEDMEFEFERENEDEEEEEERVVRGNLNVRICRNNGNDDKECFDDQFSAQSEIAIDMKQRYVGHCNVGTDIKQASFLGQKGEFVSSGSDDGKWFIWEKQTGRLVKMLTGDDAVVNCIQAHPFDCAVATSGIDNTIKMWSPQAEDPWMATSESSMLQAVKLNQRQLSNNREVMLPLELLERFHMHEFTQSFECTQS